MNNTAKLIGLVFGLLYSSTLFSLTMPKNTTRKLKVVMPSEHPPFLYSSEDSALRAMRGLDYDIAIYLQRELNIHIEPVFVPFNDLFQGLRISQGHFVMGGVEISNEKLDYYDFSESYHQSTMAILHKGSLQSNWLTSLPDNTTIAVLLGSSNELYAKELYIKYDKKIRILSLNTIKEIEHEVILGRVDMALIDTPTARILKKGNSSLNYLETERKISYAIAFPKDSNWSDPINKILLKLKKNGELNRLKIKWQVTQLSK